MSSFKRLATAFWTIGNVGDHLSFAVGAAYVHLPLRVPQYAWS
jgi:hypothetical protein